LNQKPLQVIQSIKRLGL